MNNLEYIDSFGIRLLPPVNKPDFEILGIGFHSHFDDREICSMREGVVIYICGIGIFIGIQRKYENLS